MFALLACTLLLVVSCNNIDTELVDKVQLSLNKAQEGKPALEAAIKDVSNLQDQMRGTPAGVLNSPEFGYYDLVNSVELFNQKYSSMQAAYTDRSAKLEALLGDYTDGKIKKEAVASEQEKIASELDGIQTQLERMSPMFNELSAKYAKMMATWQSLPEAEQLARSKAAVSADQAAGTAGALSPSGGALQGGSSQPAQVRPQTSNSLVLPQPEKKQ